MKRKTTLVIGLIIAASLYAVYIASGVDGVYALWDWLESLITRASLKANSLWSNIVPTDPQTEAVATALAFIANKEGFSSRAYPDPPGQSVKFSIGYGHQIVPGDGLSLTTILTESEASQLLSSDMQSRVDCVIGAVTADGVTPNQIAALISFAYNEGCAALNGSTLLKLVNDGDVEGAAAQFSEWIYVHIGGVAQVSNALVSRRAAEQALFLS